MKVREAEGLALLYVGIAAVLAGPGPALAVHVVAALRTRPVLATLGVDLRFLVLVGLVEERLVGILLLVFLLFLLVVFPGVLRVLVLLFLALLFLRSQALDGRVTNSDIVRGSLQ